MPRPQRTARNNYAVPCSARSCDLAAEDVLTPNSVKLLTASKRSGLAAKPRRGVGAHFSLLTF